jgi:hypothetical protein
MKDEDRVIELEERIAQLEQRQRRGNGRSAAETAFWAVMHNVFPEDARRHMKAAGREQLLAARVYLDNWINRLGEGDTSEADNRPLPPESIEVR